MLGPAYSYSDLVARKVFPEQELFHLYSIRDIFTMIESGGAEKAIIPIENMIHGSVRESIMGLLRHPVKINQAYTFQIHHCLAAQKKSYEIITSHPQALGQCSSFIAKQGKDIEDCDSTAMAMRKASLYPRYAAIGSPEAAEHYGLRVWYDNIEDNHDNVTRFFAISLEETIAKEKARTSLILRPKEDRPGLLFDVLAPFKLQNINLVKIESLPSGKKMEEYAFYLEIDGNTQERRVQKALQFLEDSIEVTSLGSYNVVGLK